MKKVPPYNREAEQSVLGGMLFDIRAVDQIIGIRLKAEYFYDESHRRIFETILALHKQKKPIDLVTVSDRLREEGNIESIGGAAYLAQLLDVVPTVAHIKSYAKIVIEKALARILAAEGMDLYNAAMSNQTTPVTEIAQASADRLLALSTQGDSEIPALISDSLQDTLDEIDRRYKRGSSLLGLSTGFPSIDRRTLGFQPGHLTLIAARPSMGKTALMLQLGRTQAEAGAHVTMFEIEMSRIDLTHRMLANAARVDYREIQTGENWEKNAEAVTKAAASFYSLLLRADDRTASIEHICIISKRLKLKKQLDIAYIDYLQIASTSEKTNNRHNEVSRIANMLRSLAKELRIPVVLLCQLSRAVEARTPPRPKLSDLKESGDLEQIADAVWLLYRPELYRQQANEVAEENERNLCELNIAKIRNGVIGIEKLNFFGNHQKFTERDGHHNP